MKNNNQDIVKTLRQRSAWSHEPILKEAADEIERLRTEVDHWKEIAKKRGAKIHPNSGALRIKHDASDEETLYEIKDANKTYTLSGKELLELWKRSAMELKEPQFVIYFTDADLTATIIISKGKQ